MLTKIAKFLYRLNQMCGHCGSGGSGHCGDIRKKGVNK
jgi:hypothetical protein